MGIRRVVPNLGTSDMEAARAFYVDVLGFEVGMDMGWIVTVVSRENPTAQLSLQHGDDPAGPLVTIEVDDVEAVHAAAVAKGAEIVYPMSDEVWGVRRFFVKDPSGIVLNVMSHLE